MNTKTILIALLVVIAGVVAVMAYQHEQTPYEQIKGGVSDGYNQMVDGTEDTLEEAGDDFEEAGEDAADAVEDATR